MYQNDIKKGLSLSKITQTIRYVFKLLSFIVTPYMKLY